jgi:hypothetical protein
MTVKTLSELIKRLEEIKEETGDIEIKAVTDEGSIVNVVPYIENGKIYLYD